MIEVLMVVAILSSAPLGNDRAPADGKERLAAIIKQVSQNEGLYQNLDVRVSSHYTTPSAGRPPQARKGGGKERGTQFQIIADENRTLHSVSQNRLFRFELVGSYETEDGQKSDRSRTRAFDGSMTRLRDGKIGNLITGRAEDSNFFRPHMLLLEMSRKLLPLSVYLGGDSSIKTYPQGKWDPNHSVVSEYEGTEIIGEVKCHKVGITTVIGGKPYNRENLWLAEKFNYIPIRIQCYTNGMNLSRQVLS